MNNILLISEDTLKTYSNLNDNTFGKWILPAIRESQEMGLMPIIGECLYNKICELVADGSINDVLFSAYKDLLDDKIQPYLIYKTLSNIIPILNAKLANIGSVLSNDEHVVNLTQGEADLLKTYYSERCDFYTKRLQDFVKNNQQAFPELTCGCGNMQPNLDSSENSVGLWLGGKRGKNSHTKGECGCSSSEVVCGDYQSGFTDGVEFQKRKLEITGFTENGRYISENGYSEVTVNVAQTGATLTTTAITSNGEYAAPQGYDGYSAVTVNVPHTGHTDEEMQAQYESGHTDGMADQKALLSSTTITENGTYTSENGFSAVTVNVPQSGSSYDGYTEGIIDAENAEQPLTFKIESDGEIGWWAYSNDASRTISYSKNGGEWISITSTTGSSNPTISVSSGDVIYLKGVNNNYCEGLNGESRFESTCSFEVCGNIMSLIYGDNFKGQNVLPSGHSFCYMFSNCPNITTIRHLIMPATALTDSCYTGMFSGCRNINYVKCFATSFDTYSTANWLQNVSSTGTFVKKSNVEWEIGVNGIPENWVVQSV